MTHRLPLPCSAVVEYKRRLDAAADPDNIQEQIVRFLFASPSPRLRLSFSVRAVRFPLAQNKLDEEKNELRVKREELEAVSRGRCWQSC